MAVNILTSDCGCKNNYNVSSFPTSISKGLSIAVNSGTTTLDSLMIAAGRIEYSPSVYRASGIDAPPGPPVNQVTVVCGENGAVTVSQNTSSSVENLSMAHLQNGGPMYNYSNMRGSLISTSLKSSSGNFVSQNLGPYSTGVIGKVGSFVNNKIPAGPNLEPTFDINLPPTAPSARISTQPTTASDMKSVKTLKIARAGSGYVTVSMAETSSSRIIPNPIPPAVSPILGGSGLTVSIVATAGQITNVQILNPGIDYQVGDIITVIGGGNDSRIIVTGLRSLSYRTSDCLILPSTHIFNESNPLFGAFGNSIL